MPEKQDKNEPPRNGFLWTYIFKIRVKSGDWKKIQQKTTDWILEVKDLKQIISMSMSRTFQHGGVKMKLYSNCWIFFKDLKHYNSLEEQNIVIYLCVFRQTFSTIQSFENYRLSWTGLITLKIWENRFDYNFTIKHQSTDCLKGIIYYINL